MASTLYFNQPLPLLLRLSGDDLMSLHRLQRLGALLGGAFVGQYLLQSFGSVQWKKFSYRQVIRSIVSTVGIRGLAHAAKALWKWRKPLWRISAMFMRRSSKRGASSLWFSYTATRQQRQRSPGKEYMQMRRRPKSVII
ncbi:unnamed protein product [Symbiodinium microadriaticum]|nr:unnamed protein product [Symbiodinium microadriaticum]